MVALLVLKMGFRSGRAAAASALHSAMSELLAQLPSGFFAFRMVVTMCLQDGGYHVPYAHKDLASGLDLSGYNNELYDVLSIQVCAVKKNTDRKNSNSGSSAGSEAHAEAAAAPAGAAHSASMDRQPLDRLASGRDAGYAFVYPNLMINRYG